jgi:hypothetical protein
VKLPPVSLRWNIGYPATLETFRARAEHLFALRGKPPHPPVLDERGEDE